MLRDGPDDAKATLLLAHGAGGFMDSTFLNAMTERLTKNDLCVVRFEFPYMHSRRVDGRRRPPDREPVLRATWLAAVAQAAGTTPLFIGGHSMGGRIASMVASDVKPMGLVCMSYPFHAPGTPSRPRVAHLRELNVPAVFVQGTRDPFGRPEEVLGYGLPPSIEVAWLDGADHSLKPAARSGIRASAVLDEAAAHITRFIAAQLPVGDHS